MGLDGLEGMWWSMITMDSLDLEYIFSHEIIKESKVVLEKYQERAISFLL